MSKRKTDTVANLPVLNVTLQQRTALGKPRRQVEITKYKRYTECHDSLDGSRSTSQKFRKVVEQTIEVGWTLTIEWDLILDMVDQAARNRTGRSTDGPITVKIVDRNILSETHYDEEGNPRVGDGNP